MAKTRAGYQKIRMETPEKATADFA